MRKKESLPQEASTFMNMLISSKLFYAVKGFEIISAILLLSGMYVPLALALVQFYLTLSGLI